MRPASIAIVGVSPERGSTGKNALAGLLANGFGGPIHLVSRSADEVEGIPCVRTIDALPEGIDLAVLAIPSAAIAEAVEACVRRRVRAAVVFASGFAELGDAGRAEQDRIAATALAGGLAILGPNCLGYTNFVDGLGIGFHAERTRSSAGGSGPALAVVAQSGGMMAHLSLAFAARNLRLSYMAATGNEAGLGIEDFLDFLATDPTTSAVALFAEHIRRPDDFLAALRRVRAAGKPVVLLHAGRSRRAAEAGRSHTGALAGDHAAMRVMVAQAGGILAGSLEELVDLAELTARFPALPRKGVGVLTGSGGFCGVALDLCDELGLEAPLPTGETMARLRAILPPFATPANPLDVTTQPMRQPEILGQGLAALLDDPGIGSVVVAITPGPPAQSVRYLQGLHPAIEAPPKPVILAIMGDGSPLIDPFLEIVRDEGIMLSRSPERALRAVAKATEAGRRAVPPDGHPPPPVSRVPPGPVEPATATVPEHASKALLSGIGIPVPEGALARTVDEAVAIAARLGYPVALKAQSADLPHKSDAGGVVLDVDDAAGVRAAWSEIRSAVRNAAPGVRLDGILVERMLGKGVELILGARRDPDWGPLLVLGLGGVWTEILGDVRLLPADAPEAAIVAALEGLKGAALLKGARGRGPVDIGRIAGLAARLGRFLRERPDLAEVEINPLVAGDDGTAIAADALIVPVRKRGAPG